MHTVQHTYINTAVVQFWKNSQTLLASQERRALKAFYWFKMWYNPPLPPVTHTHTHTQYTIKQAPNYTDVPVQSGLCASCNWVNGAKGCVWMHLCMTYLHTYTHTDTHTSWKASLNRESYPRASAPSTKRMRGENCGECKKDVSEHHPPFYSHPSFSSLHLTRSLTSCSHCLREKTWYCVA